MNGEGAERAAAAPAGGSRALQVALYAGFVLVGIVTVLLGPMLPYVAAAWHMSDERAGTLFTAQFAGSILGVVALSPLLRAIGFRRAVSFGFIAMALGLAGFAMLLRSSMPWLPGMATIALYGTGLGIAIPATNLFIAKLARDQRGAALNRLNAAWGIGAVACAPLWLEFLQHGAQVAFLATLAVAATCIGIWLLLSVDAVAEEAHPPSRAENIPALPLSVVFVIGLLLFLYVGVENSVGGWVATYTLRIGGRSTAFLTTSFFWAMLVLGRLASASLLRTTREARLLTISLCLAFLGTASLLVAQRPATAVFAVVVCGLGLASVYPLIVAAFSRFGKRADALATPVFAAAALGGACLPWAVGAVSTVTGNLRAGVLMPLLSCLVMLGIYRATRRTMLDAALEFEHEQR